MWTVCELWTSRCSSWIEKRQRNQRSNCQYPFDHRKTKGIPEKHLFLLQEDPLHAFYYSNSLKTDNPCVSFIWTLGTRMGTTRIRYWVLIKFFVLYFEDDVIGFCYKNASKAEATRAGPRACPGHSRETCCWCEAMLEAVKPTRLYEVPSFCFNDLHNFHCSKSVLSFRLF